MSMNTKLINLPETISVALLVIAGEFGNGDERKDKLTKAGYEYTKVQSCVNELITLMDKYNA